MGITNRHGARSWRQSTFLAAGSLAVSLTCLLGGLAPAIAQQPAAKGGAASAPTPAAPAPTQVAALTPPEQNQNGAYTVRIKDLERRVDDLREQIFRSKARLNLLKETVLHGVVAGARGVIIHRNEMGALYQPIRVVYALDGAEIFARSDDSGKLFDKNKELEVYNGSLLPGNHTLSVTVIYQGNGLGLFSYLKGYKYTVRKSNSFTVPEGKVTTVKVVGFEKGNALTTDPKDRPDLDFRSSVEAERIEGAAGKAPAAAPAQNPGPKAQ